MKAAVNILTELLTVVILCSFHFSIAQKRGNVWCFGHYASIDFNYNPPIPDSSHVISRGSCASICDTSGNLLFYAVDDTMANFSQTINGAKIFSANHQLMQFGDSINAQAWYNEIVTVSFPYPNHLYYVFTIGVTSFYGLYYSVVDMSLNGGLGAVIQKNVQLQSFRVVDCLSAVKHGNGRDWWLVFRKSDVPIGGSNNDFYKYLITPYGILNYNSQSIGTPNSTNLANICFNKEGSQFVFTNYKGMIEKYDFDRCTGVISNPVTIYPERILSNGYVNYLGSALSPDGNVLYVSYNKIFSALLQYDLTASNIVATEDTLWTQSSPINAAGHMRLAPDNKIYFTCAYVPLTAPMYPYADSLYNMYNMNLSVINQPDSLGAACDFQPYSFYLGGKRTYWGLPNNPDYDMPALAGSPCDTLTGLTRGPLPKERGAELFLTWVGSWQKLFVNAQGLKGRNVTVEVFDKLGKVISASPPAPLPEERGEVHNGYFTQDIFLPNLSDGVYIVRLKTEKEVLAKKFVKE